MKKPNILMFHRVELTKSQIINELYYKRSMVYKLSDLFQVIEKYINDGYIFGSIEQCFYLQKYFHLSFDDGFKEHLQLAKLLKKKYDLNYNDISFSINVNNSLKNKYTGMDIVYEIIEQGELDKLCELLKIKTTDFSINKVKQIIAKLKPEKLEKISNEFKTVTNALNDTFLNKNEVIKLSKLFKITSHGIAHRFLTYNKKDSEYEILQSKIILEKLTGKQINTFCYPEGKNDNSIQKYCKEAGYKYALSIRHEKNNLFCIGREIM